MEDYANVNGIVYTENGTESVYVPCGEASDVYGIEWEIKTSSEWTKILKFYPDIPGERPKYFNNYTEDKYAISDSINTSLEVQNIDISDTGLFKCRTIGQGVDYSYITLLQVVGKSLSVWFYNKDKHIVCIRAHIGIEIYTTNG